MNLQHVRELLLYTSGSSEYLETAARLSEITDRDELRKQYTSLIHSLTISGDSSVIIPEGVVLTVDGTAYTDCVLTADSL